MDAFPEALPHGPLEPVFPDVFFLTGAMRMAMGDTHLHFSRNMVVVRDGSALTLINSIRLDEAGLAALDALGTVRHVLRIGALHGRDDAFYRHRYGARLWAVPGMPAADDADAALREDLPASEAPFAGCSIFCFRQTKLPEAIVRIDREGGILVAADALQNWLGPDAFFSEESKAMMTSMGFFQAANIGPVWRQFCEPQRGDFDRLATLNFRHVLCGHGSPLRDTAREAYRERFASTFTG